MHSLLYYHFEDYTNFMALLEIKIFVKAMSFLNILVYDYTEKAQYDYFFAALVLLLMLIGFLLIKASKAPDITKLKTSIITLIQLALMRTNPKKNRLYGRIALISGTFLAFIYAYNISQIKKPEWFYETSTISGRVENVNNKTVKAGIEISFTVKDHNFQLLKDKGYIHTRNLAVNDSVTILYFTDTNPHLTPDQKKKVVKMEVVE